jgi:hypothetical protein
MDVVVLNDWVTETKVTPLRSNTSNGGVLTQFMAAPPNGGSVWVRVVDEVSGAVFEQVISADLSDLCASVRGM